MIFIKRLSYLTCLHFCILITGTLFVSMAAQSSSNSQLMHHGHRINFVTIFLVFYFSEFLKFFSLELFFMFKTYPTTFSCILPKTSYCFIWKIQQVYKCSNLGQIFLKVLESKYSSLFFYLLWTKISWY